MNGKPILKRLLIAFTGGSKDFLLELKKSISKTVKIKGGKIYDSHRSYQLRYSTSDTMKLFEFMYNNIQGELFMRRKFDKFKEYLSLRPERITEKIQVILKRHKR